MYTKSIFIGILGCFALTSSTWGVTAADMATYYQKGACTACSQTPDFTLFPKEDEIRDFPKSIDPQETDLHVIKEYYTNVAEAYRKLAKTQETRALESRNKIDLHRGSMVRSSLRTNDKGFLRRDIHGLQDGIHGRDKQTQNARALAATYTKQTYTPLANKADEYARKAEFYQELADTSAELHQGLTK